MTSHERMMKTTREAEEQTRRVYAILGGTMLACILLAACGSVASTYLLAAL